MLEKRNGQTAKEWAVRQFADADCPCCGRGIDHHFIVPAIGLDASALAIDVWVARCYEQPTCTAVEFVWEYDDSGDWGSVLEKLGCDPDPDAVYLVCYVVVDVQYDIDSVSPSDMRYIESFRSPGLYGIEYPDIPYYAFETDQDWFTHVRAIELDQVLDLRMHVAHFNVDLESFDQCVKDAKRTQKGW